MNININDIKHYCPNTFFKANSINNDKCKYIAEKRAYIEDKTTTLEELSILSFLGAVISGTIDAESIIKNKKINKLSLGLIITSAALLVAKWIKQIQLSHEYDREVKNDSKNFDIN